VRVLLSRDVRAMTSTRMLFSKQEPRLDKCALIGMAIYISVYEFNILDLYFCL